jgi:cell fate (sporulation/competence/biofilm development) regulator YlbF (YheA/YmcA/DUF963 family)
MFAESLSEFLKLNESIQSVDISCNQIEESSVQTLKDSLQGNPNITQIDVRSNQLTESTMREINEIVMRNHLNKNRITYRPLTDCKFQI